MARFRLEYQLEYTNPQPSFPTITPWATAPDYEFNAEGLELAFKSNDQQHYQIEQTGTLYVSGDLYELVKDCLYTSAGSRLNIVRFKIYDNSCGLYLRTFICDASVFKLCTNGCAVGLPVRLEKDVLTEFEQCMLYPPTDQYKAVPYCEARATASYFLLIFLLILIAPITGLLAGVFPVLFFRVLESARGCQYAGLAVLMRAYVQLLPYYNTAAAATNDDFFSIAKSYFSHALYYFNKKIRLKADIQGGDFILFAPLSIADIQGGQLNWNGLELLTFIRNTYNAKWRVMGNGELLIKRRNYEFGQTDLFLDQDFCADNKSKATLPIAVKYKYEADALDKESQECGQYPFSVNIGTTVPVWVPVDPLTGTGGWYINEYQALPSEPKLQQMPFARTKFRNDGTTDDVISEADDFMPGIFGFLSGYDLDASNEWAVHDANAVSVVRLLDLNEDTEGSFLYKSKREPFTPAYNSVYQGLGLNGDVTVGGEQQQVSNGSVFINYSLNDAGLPNLSREWFFDDPTRPDYINSVGYSADLEVAVCGCDALLELGVYEGSEPVIDFVANLKGGVKGHVKAYTVNISDGSCKATIDF